MAEQDTQKRRSGISWAVLAVVVIATPATVALSYYRLTGDPSFQPLALTVERLASAPQRLLNPDARIAIYIEVGPSPREQAEVVQLAADLRHAFYGKGQDANVFVSGQNTTGTMVRFDAAGVEIGPFPAHRAAAGVSPTVRALTIVERDEAAIEREHRW